MKYTVSLAYVVLGLIAEACGAAPPEGEDPLAKILAPALRPTVEVRLREHRRLQRYQDDDFPLPPEKFAAFREEVIQQFIRSTGLEDWVVRKPEGKKNALEGRFRDRRLKTIELHGVTIEVHVIEIPETGDRVPAVICLPPGEAVVPAVCVFSGHTRHGLRDLVLDLESYQRGVAVRLAKAGFATIAVEKIDTGYLSRDGARGVDEPEIATFALAIGRTTRACQLRACLASVEILAGHPRVDPRRIGATGVSLGGWLSVETALLTDRLAAVADFGRKTLNVPPDAAAEQFVGLRDLCHILPGMMAVCDRNLHALAYAPRAMLAGHGRTDTGSHRQGPVHFKQLFERQYAALGKADQYAYHIHAGGDTMPEVAVIEYFQRVFAK